MLEPSAASRMPRGRTLLFTWNPRYAFLPEVRALLRKALDALPESERRSYFPRPAPAAALGQAHMSAISREHTREEVAAAPDNEYQSYDLDFIRTGLGHRLDAVMIELGFASQGRHWTHPETEFWVEFPLGPVQIGDATVTRFAERRTRLGVLRLLAPTESVMDRLVAWYHWNDEQCLEQALAVAQRHPIDLRGIEEWSRSERALEKFQAFRERLRALGGPGREPKR